LTARQHLTVYNSQVKAASPSNEAPDPTMVRLKNRYLLVNILYPELEDRPGKTKVPDVVEFNQPTTDTFHAGALLKGLRAEIVNMFGDYGSGAVAESMTGMMCCNIRRKTC